MTEYKVLKSRSFDHDIERIHLFLLTNNATPLIIRKILQGIYNSLARLRTNPYIGAPLSSKTSIPNNYRYLLSGKYLIFYKIFEDEKTVRIYHVFHGKENYLVKLNLNDSTD